MVKTECIFPNMLQREKELQDFDLKRTTMHHISRIHFLKP